MSVARFTLRSTSLFVLIALLLGACTPATPNSAATPAGTPQAIGGTLVIYSGRAEPLVLPVLDLFKKSYPNVTVELVSGSNNEMAARILEERANPHADLLLTTDSLPLQKLDSEGLLVPYLSASVQAVPGAYRDAEGAWTSLTLRARVIMYNTELVTAEEAPTSIFELTDSKWKGQVAAAGSTNGAMQAQIAALRVVKGERATEEWLNGLMANDVQFFGGHTDVRNAVGAGEFKLGLVNHYYYFLEKAEGSPVGIVWPDQADGQVGAFSNPTAIGIVQGAHNPAAAQALIDFLLTVDAQNVFAGVNYEYPIVPGVPLSPDVQPLSALRLVDVSLAQMWENHAPALALIQKVGMP